MTLSTQVNNVGLTIVMSSCHYFFFTICLQRPIQTIKNVNEQRTRSHTQICTILTPFSNRIKLFKIPRHQNTSAMFLQNTIYSFQFPDYLQRSVRTESKAYSTIFLRHLITFYHAPNNISRGMETEIVAEAQYPGGNFLVTALDGAAPAGGVGGSSRLSRSPLALFSGPL